MDEITVQLRERTGKEGAAQARREGGIPAILYGAGGASRAISVNSAMFQKMLRTTGGRLSLLGLNLEGADEKEHAIIKAIQRHPVNESIIHIDFMRVSLKDKLTVEVPIETQGSAPGVKLGGVLQQAVRQITVSCLPSLIPQAAIADVSAMEIGNVLTAKDLKLPEGVDMLSDPEMPILSIALVKVEEEAPVEGAAEGVPAEGTEPAEPEVIGEKEREERRAKKEEDKEVREKEKQEIKEQRAKDQK